MPVCLDYVQGEVSLSKLYPDITDRERDGCQSPSSHRSYQTTQQQVSRPLSLNTPFGNQTGRRCVLKNHSELPSFSIILTFSG